jgi:hypothetical protein
VIAGTTFRFLVFALAGCCSLANSRAGNTTLVLDSPAGDPVGFGKNYYFTTADGTFSAQRNGAYSVTVFFANPPTNYWGLSFASADQTPLAPGTYDGATRYPFNTGTGWPGIDIVGNGSGCNNENGSFVIHEIVYGPGSTISIFHASFEQSCEGFYPPLKGEIFFNATATPPLKNHITSELAAFATKGQPFKYRITGSSSEITYSARGLPNGLLVNTNTGRISGAPTVEGSFTVTVSASDGTQKAAASLLMTVDPPSHSTGLYSAICLVSDPGEFILNGQDQVLTSADGYINAGGSIGGNSATVTIHSPDFFTFWRVNFVAPSGQQLTVGQYRVDDPNNFYGPHLDVSGNGRGCSQSTGSFEIREIEFDSIGRVRHLHATFEEHCGGSTPALRGTVWFDATEAITSLPLVELKLNQPFSYQIVANNEPIAFAAVNLPSGLMLDSSTGIITGTPSLIGKFEVAVSASNGQDEAADNLTLNVVPTPTPKPKTSSGTPVIKISVSPSQINEGEEATFTVSRSNVGAHDLTILFLTHISGPTVDFTVTPATHVTIPAGQTSATVVLDSFTDMVQEPNEIVTLKLLKHTGYTVGRQNKATLTIVDVP